MTETKFTKGPWDVRCDPCHYDSATDVVSVNSDKLHACVGGKANWAEAEANARLIAAAPDMYEALNALASQYDIFLDPDFAEVDEPEANHLLRKAIAKARGES